MRLAVALVCGLGACGRIDFAQRGLDARAPAEEGLVSPYSYIQSGASNRSSSSATAVVTFPVATVANDLLIVTMTYDDTTLDIATLTDDTGNSYARAIAPVAWASHPFHSEMWYAQDAAPASTITATFSAPTVSFFLAYADEYTGVTTLDQTSSATGLTGVTVDSGSRLVAQDGELVFGHGEGEGPAVTCGPGFATRDHDDGNCEEDQPGLSGTMAAATFALNFPGEWVAMMATFR